jgi:Tol biopolymer transport system component
MKAQNVPPGSQDGRPTLESWKEIADYFGKSVSTVQRWEREEALPVRRHTHQSQGSIYAYPHELDSWRTARTAATSPAREPDRPAARFQAWAMAVAGSALAAIAGVWLVAGHPAAAPLPGRSFQLTSEPGWEEMVSLSPDGGSAVFVAPGGKDCGSSRIFVKRVGSSEARALTGSCADYTWPRWSPDGTRIAFARERPGAMGIFAIPSAGGSEETIAVVGDPALVANGRDNIWQTWTADGKGLVVVDREHPGDPAALFLLSLETKARRRLTRPPAGTTGDVAAAASPDGRWVAVVRQAAGFDGDLYVIPAGGGEARRLTFDDLAINGIAWTPDSREIVFASSRLSARKTLWRVEASGVSAPVRVAGVIDESVWPSIAKSPGGTGFRIAYQSVALSVNLLQWGRAPAGESGPVPVCPSTSFDYSAQLSPDGRRTAFSSIRGGSRNIWICEPGGHARQVTHFSGPNTDSPRWSPDGRRLVFTARAGPSREVYLCDLETLRSWPLTDDPADDGRASFSRDGNSIYFRSNRSGRDEIWKIAATGGPARQITRNGAREGYESPDGRQLYFVKDRPLLGVWSVGTEGGEETRLIDGVRDTRWAVAREGIYYVTVAAPFEILAWRYAARESDVIYRIPGRKSVRAGFTASFDGSTFVWPQAVTDSRDIMILDDLR